MALRLDVNTLTGPQTAGKELIISQPSATPSFSPRYIPLSLPLSLPVLPSPVQSPVLRCDLISAAWRSMPPVAGGSIALNYGFIPAPPPHPASLSSHTDESCPTPPSPTPPQPPSKPTTHNPDQYLTI